MRDREGVGGGRGGTGGIRGKGERKEEGGKPSSEGFFVCLYVWGEGCCQEQELLKFCIVMSKILTVAYVFQY